MSLDGLGRYVHITEAHDPKILERRNKEQAAKRELSEATPLLQGHRIKAAAPPSMGKLDSINKSFREFSDLNQKNPRRDEQQQLAKHRYTKLGKLPLDDDVNKPGAYAADAKLVEAEAQPNSVDKPIPQSSKLSKILTKISNTWENYKKEKLAKDENAKLAERKDLETKLKKYHEDKKIKNEAIKNLETTMKSYPALTLRINQLKEQIRDKRNEYKHIKGDQNYKAEAQALDSEIINLKSDLQQLLLKRNQYRQEFKEENQKTIDQLRMSLNEIDKQIKITQKKLDENTKVDKEHSIVKNYNRMQYKLTEAENFLKHENAIVDAKNKLRDSSNMTNFLDIKTTEKLAELIGQHNDKNPNDLIDPMNIPQKIKDEAAKFAASSNVNKEFDKFISQSRIQYNSSEEILDLFINVNASKKTLRILEIKYELYKDFEENKSIFKKQKFNEKLLFLVNNHNDKIDNDEKISNKDILKYYNIRDIPDNIFKEAQEYSNKQNLNNEFEKFLKKTNDKLELSSDVLISNFFKSYKKSEYELIDKFKDYNQLFLKMENRSALFAKEKLTKYGKENIFLDKFKQKFKESNDKILSLKKQKEIEYQKMVSDYTSTYRKELSDKNLTDEGKKLILNKIKMLSKNVENLAREIHELEIKQMQNALDHAEGKDLSQLELLLKNSVERIDEKVQGAVNKFLALFYEP